MPIQFPSFIQRVNCEPKKVPQQSAQKEQSMANTAFTLGVVKALFVPGTQPLQVTMRWQQVALKSGKVLSIKDAAKELYSNSPKKLAIPTAFFRGALPAMGKEFIKNGTYKAVAFKGAPKLVKKAGNEIARDSLRTLPKLVQHTAISLFAAGVAATADTILGGPFERYATFAATSQGDKANVKFFEGPKTMRNIVDTFYKGGLATFGKTALSCSVLFGASGPTQKLIYQQNNLKTGDKIPIHVAGQTAFATGVAVAMVSSPLDIVKTMSQMPGASKDIPVFKTLSQNIKRFGLNGAFAGVPLKMALTIIGWGTVSAITQQTSTVPKEEKFIHTF